MQPLRRLPARAKKLALRALGVAVLWLLETPAAEADQELWTASETRVRWTSPTRFIPSMFRVWSETRFTKRHDGLGVGFLRAGPIWDINPHLFIVLQGVVAPFKGADNSFITEYRIEFEPNLLARWGDFTMSDRNRASVHWRDGEPTYLYRNLPRINYAPQGQWWQPFLADEVIYDVGNTQLLQNRTFLGLGVLLDGRSRLDMSVFARARRDAAHDWTWDQGIMLYLYFDPPRSQGS